MDEGSCVGSGHLIRVEFGSLFSSLLDDCGFSCLQYRLISSLKQDSTLRRLLRNLLRLWWLGMRQDAGAKGCGASLPFALAFKESDRPKALSVHRLAPRTLIP